MLNIENLIIMSIILLFPLAVYLIYIAYIRNMDISEKNILIDLVLLSSLFLSVHYQILINEHIIVLSSIPLLISYLKKRTTTSIIISIILIGYCNVYLDLNIFLLMIEYTILFLGYKINKKADFIVNLFVCVKSFFCAFFMFSTINPEGNILSNLITVFTPTILFVFFVYIIIYLLRKANDIINLNIILQEAKKEQKLYMSLSKLTHELKNPIAVCKGYLEIIEKNKNEKTEKYLSIISDEINRALTVINDFSSLGKLKTITKEEVDIYLLLEEVVDALNQLFKKNNAELVLILDDELEELYMQLDYNKFKQVLVNIIKNALEAKKENGKLRVELSIKKVGKVVKITIKDNGIGMSKETLDSIYEIFYTTKQNGNGLGVVLSKEIIELHKGTINYKSALDKGTTVTIKLPI